MQTLDNKPEPATEKQKKMIEAQMSIRQVSEVFRSRVKEYFDGNIYLSKTIASTIIDELKKLPEIDVEAMTIQRTQNQEKKWNG